MRPGNGRNREARPQRQTFLHGDRLRRFHRFQTRSDILHRHLKFVLNRVGVNRRRPPWNHMLGPFDRSFFHIASKRSGSPAVIGGRAGLVVVEIEQSPRRGWRPALFRPSNRRLKSRIVRRFNVRRQISARSPRHPRIRRCPRSGRCPQPIVTARRRSPVSARRGIIKRSIPRHETIRGRFPPIGRRRIGRFFPRRRCSRWRGLRRRRQFAAGSRRPPRRSDAAR